MHLLTSCVSIEKSEIKVKSFIQSKSDFKLFSQVIKIHIHC